MTVDFVTPYQFQAESREELCMLYVEKLRKVNPSHELLRYYLLPKNGDEWRAILDEFTERYSNKELPSNETTSYRARSYFSGNLALDLAKALEQHGIPV